MHHKTIKLTRTASVATILLNRPATLNAISTTMINEINEALDVATGTSRALIVGAAGKSFCAGGDLSGGLPVGSGPDGPDFGAVLDSHINPLISRLRSLPIPWITAVRGAAAGFGCALALAGDMVVASESANFIQAFTRIGLVPDGGSTHILARGAGRVRAMEAMLLAEPVRAATALDWGLINRVVPDDQLEGTANTIAERLAAGPTVALGMIRKAVWDATDDNWAAMLNSERASQRIAGRTRDAGEGITAFLTKRPAAFTGR